MRRSHTHTHTHVRQPTLFGWLTHPVGVVLLLDAGPATLYYLQLCFLTRKKKGEKVEGGLNVAMSKRSHSCVATADEKRPERLIVEILSS